MEMSMQDVSVTVLEAAWQSPEDRKVWDAVRNGIPNLQNMTFEGWLTEAEVQTRVKREFRRQSRIFLTRSEL